VSGAAPKASLACIMSEQCVEDVSKKYAESRDFDDFGNEDEALALALARSLAESEGDVKGDKEEDGEDFALAMQLQEEENAAYEEFRNEQSRAGKVCMRTGFDIPRREHAEKRLYTADDAEEVHAEAVLLSQAFAVTPPKDKGRLFGRDKSLLGQGGDEPIITKHDEEINGQKYWDRVGQLPSGIRTGDTTGRRKISNKVYNSLHHNLKKQSGVVKGLSSTVERDAIQTHSKGLDQHTRLLLHKMVNAGHLEQVNGVIRTGKEAVVFHATGFFEISDNISKELGEDEGGNATAGTLEGEDTTVKARVFKEFAIKVFKTSLMEFKNRLDYIKGDHRFRDVANLSRQNPRKVVKVWAEKETRNLFRLRNAGLPCPYPVSLKEHVLLLEFIGENGHAAPQLREVELSERKLEKCYFQVVLLMHAMAVLCGLVHADLSEYNILYMRGKCFLVDCGQAVLFEHPNAKRFLEVDCTNVANFFKKRGLTNVVPPERLVEMLTACVEESKRPNGENMHTTAHQVPTKVKKWVEEFGDWASLPFASAILNEFPMNHEQIME